MSAADLTDDDHALAAELAFGLLAAEERRRAEARLGTDPLFAEAHRQWQEHVARFFDGEEPPRPSLWLEIARRVPANDSGVALARRAAAWPWKIATAVSGTSAVALAFILVARGPQPAPPQILTARPPLVALLTGRDAQTVAVSFDRANGRLTLIPRDLMPAGRVPELWLIPADGRPRALGALASSGGQWRLSPPAAARLFAPGATIAVSLERSDRPLPSSPAGPVVLSGKLVAAKSQQAS